MIFLTNLVWLSGCGGGESTNSNQKKTTETGNANSGKKQLPSDNVENLLEIILLPVVPEEVIWLEEAESNPKKILAVLQYPAEGAQKLVTIVEKNKQPEQVELGIEDWYPAELKAQAQLSGMEMLKGTAYGANDFFNIPYGSGRITRIEGTGFFVLELTAAN